jgi:hypothetical protein
VLGIAKMFFQFQLQEGIERFLHHRLKQLFGIHGLSAATGVHLVHQ